MFHTSPFHDAFKGRGFPFPDALSFARNIKICPGQSAPRLEVDQIESSESKLATLLLAPHMQAESWKSSTFKVELIAFRTVLHRVANDMRTRAKRQSSRDGSLSAMFATRASEPMSSFKTIDATDFVMKAYDELDGNLRTLPVRVPLSTESFEPVDYCSRLKKNIHCRPPDLFGDEERDANKTSRCVFLSMETA